MKTIKLKHLIADFTKNVRFANNYGNIEDLADNILEIGIVTPLMVEQTGNEFSVISGHRRFSALKLLLETNRIDENYEVPVTIREFKNEIERSSFKLLANDSQSISPDEWMAEIARLVEILTIDKPEIEAIEEVSKAMGKRLDYVKNAYNTWKAMDETARELIRSGKVGVTIASVLAKKSTSDKLASLGVQFAAELIDNMKEKGVNASQEIVGQGIVNTQSIVLEKAKKGEAITENIIGEIALQQIIGITEATKKANKAKREIVVFEDNTPDFDSKELYELLQAIRESAENSGQTEISEIFEAIIKQCDSGKINPKSIINKHFKNLKAA
jgi:ParB-like chromosome segregation protein Spo0J